MRGLYAILDTGALAKRRILPHAFAAGVLGAHPAALQLRAKGATAREVLALLRLLVPMCRRAGVPLVCNDRPDLAVLGGASFVHLGQDDAPVDLVRRLFPQLRVGLSTHDPEQLARALASRPDYVAYGPVFATSTKENPDPVVGLEGLRRAAELAAAAGIPLVAIGGITIDNADAVGAIASSGAVIAGLLPTEAREIPSRAAALHRALSRAHEGASVA